MSDASWESEFTCYEHDFYITGKVLTDGEQVWAICPVCQAAEIERLKIQLDAVVDGSFIKRRNYQIHE